MNTSLLSLSLLAGAAGLAVWLENRLGAHAPADWPPVVLHLAASLVAAGAVAPAAIERLVEVGGAAVVLAVCGVALPALAYVLTAALWVLKLLRRALVSGPR